MADGSPGAPVDAERAAADRVEDALKFLEGRWKLVILFRLFGGKVLRFSDLERSIPAISQKMLIQQLRQMEADGIVRRIVHHQVPPKVEYGLTDWGQALCPALDALLKWAEKRGERTAAEDVAPGGDGADDRGPPAAGVTPSPRSAGRRSPSGE
jgi:DNA-binding HxlR family transcriptional regulator